VSSQSLRLFEPGEAAHVAAEQAAAPRAREMPGPRPAPMHRQGAASPAAMRLFEPGEAVDIAIAQAAAAPAERPAPKPAGPVPLDGGAFSLSTMRLFEPGEAADVAAAQNAAHPAPARPSIARARAAGPAREAEARDLGAWAYPSELGEPPRASTGGLAALPRIATAPPDYPDPLLPELPREKRGPYSVSIVAHALIIAVVIARTSWLAAHLEASPAPDPGLMVALQQPQPEPQPPKPPIQAPPKSPRPAPEPEAQRPQPQAQELTPPLAPKQLPPQTPLPEPTRMGEQVPVPHYPVPGTVPPEEQKTGKAGAPGEKAPPPEPIGSANGTNDTDPGAGALKGPGSPAEGEDDSRDSGLITEKFLGGLDIRSHRSGRGKQGSGESEGGGSRRGFDFRLPGGNLGDFVFEDKDYDWNDYRSQMYYAILRAWYNRLYLMTGNFERWSFLKSTRALRGTVLIRFVIERSGAVSTIEVLEPSVMTPLDESAKGALKEVILPRLPADFKKDHEAVTGRFIMDVDDVGDFKQGLAWGKRQGEF
jgi:outer membrane biosynthesis protein TonB